MSIAAGDTGLAGPGRPAGSLIRCARCGTHRLAGSTARCRACHEDGGEPVDASGPVTLHSFTEIHRSFPGVATPVVLGWVDHPSGVRLLCRIDSADAAALAPGAGLELIDQAGDAAGAGDHGVAYWCRPVPAPAGPGCT